MRVSDGLATTRKEAIQRALDELGVELHEVEIEIVDEGSKGILGLGRRDVHVRVTAAHLPDDGSEELADDNIGNRIDAPEPKRESPQQQRSGNRNRGARPRRGRGDGQGGNRSEGSGNRAKPPHKVKSAGSGETRRRERPERSEPRPEPKRAPRPQRSTPVDKEAAESMGKSAAALLEEVIAKMGMEATVESSLNEEENIILDVSSESSAILIGRKGRNLEALQFIMNRIVLQGDDAETVDRLVVDIEGYLRRRRENLEDMAYNMAAKAKTTNRSVRLKPLDPQERRIVHLALEDDSEVRTFSLGSSMLRRVVIVPEGAEDEDDYADNGRNSRRRGNRGRDRTAEPDAGADAGADTDAVTEETEEGEPDES